MLKTLYRKIHKYGVNKSVKLAKSILLKKYYYQPFKKSFSQYGEDIIINKLLNNKPKGFYVDVGAFEPDRLSNTKKFYLKGWQGINIEPNPDGIKKFNILRKRDINLNIGISDKKGEMICYKFKESNSYTFSKELFNKYIEQGFHLEKKFRIAVDTLQNVFNKYLIGRKIDFISIDIENRDIAALVGNNWEIYRPRVICIESLSICDKDYDKKQERFLNGVNYKKVYENGLNSFYVDLALPGTWRKIRF